MCSPEPPISVSPKLLPLPPFHFAPTTLVSDVPPKARHVLTTGPLNVKFHLPGKLFPYLHAPSALYAEVTFSVTALLAVPAEVKTPPIHPLPCFGFLCSFQHHCQ